MRFRLIEKDGPGAANVGLDDQHIQGTEDSIIASESKTYIGSSTKKKVDMNKIKNTKIGDDIHYYVNGTEGRGVVVKMGSQYLDIFQQDGNVKTVNINDTFFVKDILINKQWDDMDDTERYVALQKIHAPTPRYIIKSWSALPEEIKDLLRKDGGLSGGSGSTYEEGETSDSETQDHARTGFAQNTQYSKKVESVEKKEDPQLEHHLRRKRTKEEKKTGVMSLGNPKYYTLDNPKWQGDKSKIPQPYSKTDYRTGVSTVIGGKGQWSGKERDLRHARRKFHKDDETKMSDWEKEHERFNINQDKLDAEQKELQEQKGVVPGGSAPTTTTTTQVPPTPKNQEIEAQRRVQEDKKKPKETDTCPTCGSKHKKEEPKKEGKLTGGFVQDEDEYKNVSNSLFEGIPGEIYKNWLESQKDSVTGKQSKEGQPGSKYSEDIAPGVLEDMDEDEPQSKEGQATDERYRGYIHDEIPKKGNTITDTDDISARQDIRLRGENKSELEALFNGEYRELVKAKAFRKLKPVYEGDTKESTVKSDVEQGKYSNPGSTPEVGVSTDTKVDVPVSTGYEERPHISVEEAGKLPRSTFNPHGNDELHVRGSQDSKDQPKFSQPANQSQPVRKVGVPDQHPNSYGVRYGMKGGVKKVWCPEHQLWEETTKDWHE